MKSSILLCLFLCLSFLTGRAQDGDIKPYDDILFDVYNLRTVEVKKLLDAKQSETQEFSVYCEFLYNFAEVLELALSEDDTLFEKYEESLNARLERIDKKADKNAPSYHMIMGDIYAHAAMAYILNNDYFAGFRKLLKANRSTRLNEKIHPDYWYNNKLNGTLNVSFDMMPSLLKTISSMFGLKGDAEKGYQQLDQYLKDVDGYVGLKSEAMLYYTFSLKVARDEERAYHILAAGIDTSKTPALITFLASNIMFLTARNDEALTYMSYFPRKEIQVPFHQADYMLGKEKLNALAPDADVYLLKFMDKSKSKNYSREVCIKLAHHYLIHGDKGKYDFYKNKMNEYPKAKTDRDREADVEMERPYPPHVDLLKAKYLVQGGYYHRAAQLLKNISKDSLNNQAYINEYDLYKAIIYANIQDPQEALKYCQQVINCGEYRSEHYASQAALVAANIQLNEGNKQEAIDYLKLTKKINGQKDVYIEVIHKKATNMLNQLKKG